MPEGVGYGGFGTSFFPGEQDNVRRRPQDEGEALRILALTLPAVLGPGAVAPDILLNAQGGAGGMAPGQGQGSQLSSMIAESVIQGILGGPQQGPLAGLGSQVAPRPPIAPAGMQAPTTLTGQPSLGNLIRAEATRPTGQAAIQSSAQPAPGPSFAGAQPGGVTQQVGPPRVTPSTEPIPPVRTPTFEPVLPAEPGGQSSPPVDLGGLLRQLQDLGLWGQWGPQP